mmetsp:Transcript_47680/g.126043  ORF Transcript_47680/g.126043 Transcript_47680/m.126043 type:complete len:300 (+) Transcript_47680:789-1688(+)
MRNTVGSHAVSGRVHCSGGQGLRRKTLGQLGQGFGSSGIGFAVRPFSSGCGVQRRNLQDLPVSHNRRDAGQISNRQLMRQHCSLISACGILAFQPVVLENQISQRTPCALLGCWSRFSGRCAGDSCFHNMAVAFFRWCTPALLQVACAWSWVFLILVASFAIAGPAPGLAALRTVSTKAGLLRALLAPCLGATDVFCASLAGLLLTPPSFKCLGAGGRLPLLVDLRLRLGHGPLQGWGCCDDGWGIACARCRPGLFQFRPQQLNRRPLRSQVSLVASRLLGQQRVLLAQSCGPLSGGLT